MAYFKYLVEFCAAMKSTYLLLIMLFCMVCIAHAQTGIDTSVTNPAKVNYAKQLDAIDILYLVLKKDPSKRLADTLHPTPGKVYFSGAPAIAYSLQTGAAALVNGVFAFYMGPDATTKISSIQAEVQYTQKSQLLVPFRINMWSKNNRYNFIGDWRFLKYPQDTYGIGGKTSLDDAYTVDYDYARFYQFVLTKIKNELYAGLGVQYDNHWKIKEEDPPVNSDYQKYGFSKSSVSSGLALNVLYNTRKNILNPEGGTVYMNVIVRQNFTWLGSNSAWSSAIIDLRKYVSVGNNGNVLAFWNYDWLTLNGNPPYLDLPSNGWDTYGNTGRGYAQNRYRGKNMLYAEGEYRFGITRNKLIGATVFGNAATFTNMQNKFDGVLPGAGVGLRVMFNKFSQTHVAVDYAVGKGGSRGIFLNLGEYF